MTIFKCFHILACIWYSYIKIFTIETGQSLGRVHQAEPFKRLLLNAYYYPCPRWTGALLFTATQLVQKSLPVYLFTSKLFKILKSYFHKPYTITTKTRLSSLYIHMYILYIECFYTTLVLIFIKSPWFPVQEQCALSTMTFSCDCYDVAPLTFLSSRRRDLWFNVWILKYVSVSERIQPILYNIIHGRKLIQ